MATTKAKPRRQTSAWVENIKTIVYAGLIAIGVRTVAFEPFNIPSGSMIPTLLVGDYLFVSKYSYGYSTFSLPFSPPLFSGRIFGSLPKRGDVVVFKYPRDTSVDYIKRIVGLPGDRIQVQAGPALYQRRTLPARVRGRLPGRRQRHQDDAQAVCGDAAERRQARHPEGARRRLGQQHAGISSSRRIMCSRWATTATTAPTAGSWTGSASCRSKTSSAAPEILFFSIDAEYPWWEVWEWPFEIRWSRLLKPVH